MANFMSNGKLIAPGSDETERIQQMSQQLHDPDARDTRYLLMDEKRGVHLMDLPQVVAQG